MAKNWTQEDRDEWNRLTAMDDFDRSPADEVRLRGLMAKRELVAIAKEKAIEKAGPLYKVSTALAVGGVGSCVGGAAGGEGTLIGVGVGLLMVGGLLGGLNKWLMGVK